MAVMYVSKVLVPLFDLPFVMLNLISAGLSHRGINCLSIATMTDAMVRTFAVLNVDFIVLYSDAEKFFTITVGQS